MPGAEEDAEVAGLRVSTLCVACKALFNLCAATGIGGLGVEVRQALGEALAALNEDTQLARQHPEAVQVRQCIPCLEVPMHLPDTILQLCFTDPQRMQVVTRLQAALCV
jgi:hypothetical protein